MSFASVTGRLVRACRCMTADADGSSSYTRAAILVQWCNDFALRVNDRNATLRSRYWLRYDPRFFILDRSP